MRVAAVPVRVTWIDAAGATTAWTGLDDLQLTARTIVSVGWLLPGTLDGHAVIAQSYDAETGSVDGVLQIPLSPNVTVRQLDG